MHVGIPCLFRRLTGIPCPGCGLTRALLCLLRGDIRGALAYNALAIPIFALALTILGWTIADRLRGTDSLRRFYARIAPRKAWIVSTAAAVTLLNWAAQIAKEI